MSRITAVFLLCLLLATPAAAAEQEGIPASWWEQVWHGVVELFGLGGYEEPQDPSAVAGAEGDELGPIIIPHG